MEDITPLQTSVTRTNTVHGVFEIGELVVVRRKFKVWNVSEQEYFLRNVNTYCEVVGFVLRGSELSPLLKPLTGVCLPFAIEDKPDVVLMRPENLEVNGAA